MNCNSLRPSFHDAWRQGTQTARRLAKDCKNLRKPYRETMLQPLRYHSKCPKAKGAPIPKDLSAKWRPLPIQRQTRCGFSVEVKTLFPKAARPAVPCATSCYHPVLCRFKHAPVFVFFASEVLVTPPTPHQQSCAA